MVQRIRGVLFDKDGTLFDFQATWGSWAAALLDQLAAGDKNHKHAMAQAIGFDPATRQFRPGSAVIAGTMAQTAALLHPFLPEQTLPRITAILNQAARDVPLVPAVPLMPLFRRLCDAGLTLGVATNDAEAPARAHLAAAGISRFFAFVSGYDSGHGHKPGPGPCLAFARQMGLAPAAVAMVGDSTQDLLAGRAAGMAAIGVLTGPAGRAELTPHADTVLPDVGALINWLGLDQLPS